MKNKNKEGNAFVEFVLAITLFLTILLGMLEFSEVLLAKRRALSMARFGAWLQATTPAWETPDPA